MLYDFLQVENVAPVDWNVNVVLQCYFTISALWATIHWIYNFVFDEGS